MPLLGGTLCEVAYTNPLLPPPLFFYFFYSNQWGGGGGEAWALVPLSYMPVTVVQPGFVNGSEVTERGEGVGRFFWNFVYENDIFLHIKCHY